MFNGTQKVELDAWQIKKGSGVPSQVQTGSFMLMEEHFHKGSERNATDGKGTPLQEYYSGPAEFSVPMRFVPEVGRQLVS